MHQFFGHQTYPKVTDPGKVASLLRIIIAAMVMGCLMFGAFVVFTQGPFNQPAKEMQLSLMAAGMALTSTLLAFVIPPIVVQSQTRNANGDRQTFLQAYATMTIIAVALLEGSTFFVIFTIMSEHHWWSLAIAVFLIGLMLTHIPSKMRIEQWLDENGAHEEERPVG